MIKPPTKRYNKKKATRVTKVKSLHQEIEVLSNSQDTLDQNIFPYVEHLMLQLKNLGPMAPMDLTTREGALKAAEDANKTLDKLDSHLAVIRSLRQILEKQRGS